MGNLTGLVETLTLLTEEAVGSKWRRQKAPERARHRQKSHVSAHLPTRNDRPAAPIRLVEEMNRSVQKADNTIALLSTLS